MLIKVQDNFLIIFTIRMSLSLKYFYKELRELFSNKIWRLEEAAYEQATINGKYVANKASGELICFAHLLIQPFNQL